MSERRPYRPVSFWLAARHLGQARRAEDAALLRQQRRQIRHRRRLACQRAFDDAAQLPGCRGVAVAIEVALAQLGGLRRAARRGGAHDRRGKIVAIDGMGHAVVDQLLQRRRARNQQRHAHRDRIDRLGRQLELRDRMRLVLRQADDVGHRDNLGHRGKGLVGQEIDAPGRHFLELGGDAAVGAGADDDQAERLVVDAGDGLRQRIDALVVAGCAEEQHDAAVLRHAVLAAHFAAIEARRVEQGLVAHVGDDGAAELAMQRDVRDDALVGVLAQVLRQPRPGLRVGLALCCGDAVVHRRQLVHRQLARAVEERQLVIVDIDHQRAAEALLDQRAELQRRQARLAGDHDVGPHALGDPLDRIEELRQVFARQGDHRQRAVAHRLPDVIAVARELEAHYDDVAHHALQHFAQHVGAAERVVANVPGDHERGDGQLALVGRPLRQHRQCGCLGRRLGLRLLRPRRRGWRRRGRLRLARRGARNRQSAQAIACHRDRARQLFLDSLVPVLRRLEQRQAVLDRQLVVFLLQALDRTLAPVFAPAREADAQQARHAGTAAQILADDAAPHRHRSGRLATRLQRIAEAEQRSAGGALERSRIAALLGRQVIAQLRCLLDRPRGLLGTFVGEPHPALGLVARGLMACLQFGNPLLRLAALALGMRLRLFVASFQLALARQHRLLALDPGLLQRVMARFERSHTLRRLGTFGVGVSLYVLDVPRQLGLERQHRLMTFGPGLLQGAVARFERGRTLRRLGALGLSSSLHVLDALRQLSLARQQRLMAFGPGLFQNAMARFERGHTLHRLDTLGLGASHRVCKLPCELARTLMGSALVLGQGLLAGAQLLGQQRQSRIARVEFASQATLVRMQRRDLFAQPLALRAQLGTLSHECFDPQPQCRSFKLQRVGTAPAFGKAGRVRACQLAPAVALGRQLGAALAQQHRLGASGSQIDLGPRSLRARLIGLRGKRRCIDVQALALDDDGIAFDHRYSALPIGSGLQFAAGALLVGEARAPVR
jgi:hypothetical protein